MPRIGIIKGFGESEKASELLCRLIKALNRRFRSKIEIREMPVGNYELYGTDLTSDSIARMFDCDAVISGDIEAKSNFIDYNISDIAAALRCDTEFLHIKGIRSRASVDVRIASYFDGGIACRDTAAAADGCRETRLCTTFAVMNIVRFICRECEERRRRLVFVKDSENEFYAKLFYKYFEDFVFPIPNFYIVKTTAADIAEEVLLSPSDFDTIISSKSVSDMLFGIYRFIMGEDFTAYYRFEREKSLYYIKSLCHNAGFGTSVPSFDCYISAFSDMIKEKFGMEKEEFCLKNAAFHAHEKGFSADNAEEYLSEIIRELDKPMTTKFKKHRSARVYIK